MVCDWKIPKPNEEILALLEVPMRKQDRKKFKLKVTLIHEMSRERVVIPQPKVIPDKRRSAAENEARAIAARFGEEI